MFSNTLGFLSSSNNSDQVSHPYKTTGKIITLYISISLQFSKVPVLTEVCQYNFRKFYSTPCVMLFDLYMVSMMTINERSKHVGNVIF
jgi:hypothetical protein